MILKTRTHESKEHEYFGERRLPKLKKVHTLEFFEESVLRKSHKQSFPKDKHTSTNIIDYVHNDL